MDLALSGTARERYSFAHQWWRHFCGQFIPVPKSGALLG